ncbi:MAG: VOC family protein [Halobacteria archaeon]
MVFSQIYLMVTDLERSREFFEDVLGFEPVSTGSSSVVYRDGGVELKLQSDFTEEEYGAFNLEPPGDRRGAGSVFNLETSDQEELNGFFERIRDSDVGEAVTEPMDVDWCYRMFLARSPDGYMFEVYC